MRTNTKLRLGSAAVLAVAAASPALAQDPSFCSGASSNGQWIGGAESASDVTGAPAYMEQMALVLQNNEYVSLFSVSAPTEVRMEAQGRGSGDPAIDLRDEAGTVLLSDDDSGGDGASRAETTLQPGRYCLSLRSYDGSPMTGFVRVGRTEHEALTPGQDTATQSEEPAPAGMDAVESTDPMLSGGSCDLSTVANFLGDGQPLDVLLSSGPVTVAVPAAEVPFWGFELSAPTSLSITAENTQADPSIALYDAQGAYLAENDDWDGLNSRIDQAVPLQPGSYCIAVNALSDPSQPITVSVSEYDAQAAQVGMYERGEASPPLDGSYPVTALGTLATRLRQDVQTTDATTWFSFDVPEGGLVLIEAVTNGQGDPSLVLFDDFGRQVAFNDDNGESYDSLVTARVMPGTYLVGVRQLGEGTQALTRMLFERYVPAQ